LEPLLTAFVAGLLGGWADKTQRVAALLRERFAAGPVTAALIVAAALNSLAAAFAGTLIRLEISLNAGSLLLAIALLFAGVAGLIGEKPKPPRARGGALLASLGAMTAAGWGDKTQYLTAALAAYYGSFLPVAAAAFLGTVAVALPAALGGKAFDRAVPLRPVRIACAALFLLAGAIVLVNALGLVKG
jgi:putative Ca2+/H+ antiporter (TMEM165/GDT1 family)